MRTVLLLLLPDDVRSRLGRFKKINFEVETKTPSNFFPFAISVNCVKYYLSKSPQSGCSLTTKFGQSACLVEVAQYACTCLLIFLKR